MTKEEYKEKLTWLESIPKTWVVKPLLSVTKEKSVRSSNGELLSVYLDRGVIRASDGSLGTHAPSEVMENYQAIEPGDFILNNQQAWRGSVGVSFEDGIISPAYLVLRLSEELDWRYSNYLLRARPMVDQFMLASQGVGTIQRQIHTPSFKNVLTVIPPIGIQQNIAVFLDEKTKVIDELVEKKERLIELLREKRAALITRAVTKGLDPKAKMKPSGIDWLGDIPAGWEIKKIKHVATVNRKSLSEDSTSPDFEFDYVDIGNVNNEGKILELQNYFFSNAPLRARRLAENGDVIISTVRTYLRAMAKISNAENLVFSTGFAIFHPVKVLANWLYWSMQSNIFLAHVMANSTGVNYPGINEQKLSSISLLIPNEKEQQQIVDFLDTETAKIDKTAALIESQIEKLKEYRSSLIYHAVTGKIKI